MHDFKFLIIILGILAL